MVELFRAVRRDLAAFGHRLMPTRPPEPGLRTYRFDSPDRHERIHLRIEPDGTGVLFVNVTDVIHLNPTGNGLMGSCRSGQAPSHRSIDVKIRTG